MAINQIYAYLFAALAAHVISSGFMLGSAWMYGLVSPTCRSAWRDYKVMKTGVVATLFSLFAIMIGSHFLDVGNLWIPALYGAITGVIVGPVAAKINGLEMKAKCAIPSIVLFSIGISVMGMVYWPAFGTIWMNSVV